MKMKRLSEWDLGTEVPCITASKAKAVIPGGNSPAKSEL